MASPSCAQHRSKGTIHPWRNWGWGLVHGGQLVLWQLSREGAEGLDEVQMCMRKRVNLVITASPEHGPEGARPAGSSGSPWAVGPILLSQTRSQQREL